MVHHAEGLVLLYSGNPRCLRWLSGTYIGATPDTFELRSSHRPPHIPETLGMGEHQILPLCVVASDGLGRSSVGLGSHAVGVVGGHLVVSVATVVTDVFRKN